MQQSGTKKRSFFSSLSFKITALLSGIAIVLGSLLFWLTSTAYNNTMFEDYGRIGKSYLDAATVLVNKETLEIVTADGGDQTPEYAELQDQLERFYDQSDEFVSYLYIYQFFTDEHGNKMIRVVCDIDPESADTYGTVFSMEEDYKAEMDTPLMDPMNKEIVGPMVSSGKWGWLISVYHPVNADDGSVIAYVCVDIDVNAVVARTNKLRMVLGFIQGTFLILFAASIYIFFRSSVLSPLLRLEKAALHFKENMSKDEDAQSMAKRKDEFGALYRALSDMEDVILSDREKLEEYVEKIRVMAYQDELTGVKNLNSYDKKLEELDLQIKSGEAVFAVVMVDMNDLKVVNDMFGHGKGDIALKVTSHKICETFKHSPVFRIGGDEFVVILQGRDYEDRDKLVSELRKGEVRRNLEAKEPWQQFCVSVGCAEYKPGTHRSTKNVFDEADNLMYEHKKMLGGRVEDYKRRLA